MSRPAAVEYAAALPLRDGHVLLGLRSANKTLFPSCWDLIGGHVEAGETPAQALERELAEELGIGGLTYAPWLVFEETEPGGRLARMHTFIVTAWTGVLHVANDEHSEVRWFDLEAAERLQPVALDAYAAMFAELRRQLQSQG